MTQYNSSVQQRHQRRLSTVHLDGLSIVTGTLWAHGEMWHRRSSGVLMHALLIETVSLSTGQTTDSVGYTRNVVRVDAVVPSRTLKSPEDATQRQVGLHDTSRPVFFHRSISFDQLLRQLQLQLLVCVLTL